MTDQHLGGASLAAPSAGQADHPLLEALDATLHIPAWTSGDDDAAGAAASSFGAGVEGSGGGAATPSEDKPRRRRLTTTRKKAAKSSDEETEAPSADPEGADGAPADDDGEAADDGGRKRRRRGSRGGRRRKRSDDDAVEIDAIPGEDDDLGASASDSDEEEAPRRKKKRATKKARRSKAAAEPEDADAESSPDPDDAEAEDGEEDGGRKKKRRRRRSRRKSKASGDEEDDEAAEEPADDEPASRSKRKKKATKAKRATKTAEEKAAEAEALRTNTILVNAVEPEERRVAVVDGDRIIDFLMNAESQKTLVNDIYRGRVVNLEPAIGAAFIDFGQGRNGFLHTSDVLPVYGDDDFRIDDLLKAGIHDEEGDHDADWSEEADALDDIAEEIADVDDLEDEDHEVEEPSEDSEEPREKSKRKRTRRTAKKADPEPAEESEPADEGEPADQDEDDAPKARTRRKRSRGGRRGKAEPAEQTADEAADGDPGAAAPAEAEEAPSAPRFGLLPDPDPAPSDGDGEDDGESVGDEAHAPHSPQAPDLLSDRLARRRRRRRGRRRRRRVRRRGARPQEAQPLAEEDLHGQEVQGRGRGRGQGAKKASKKKAAKKKASKKKASSKKAASKKKEPKSRRSGGSKSGRGRGGRGQRERRTQRERRPIDQLLKVGDPVVVQVTKDAIGDKGPTLTTYISMPGRYLVLMPSMSRTGVSRKIPDEKERKRLKRILASMNTPKDMGVIVRTAGVGRTKADLQRDLDYLLGLWESFGEKLTASRGPAPLYLESDVATRTLRDLFDRRTKEVIVDDFSVYEQMVGFAKALMPEHVDRIKRHEGDRPLFQHAGLEQDFERIFARRVDLPSGGSVVFDQAEALVAIDVNSGRTRADTYDFEDIALKTNLEAVPEIARQIKLRDLGGIIVCDFIDMMRSASNRQVEKALRTALADDRARAKIGRISQFGLLELTRQRLGPGTHKKVFQACPRCRGTGRIGAWNPAPRRSCAASAGRWSRRASPGSRCGRTPRWSSTSRRTSGTGSGPWSTAPRRRSS